MDSAASISQSELASPVLAPQGEETLKEVAPCCTTAWPSLRRRSVALPLVSIGVRGVPMIESPLRSIWKPDSMAQVSGLVRLIRGDEDCQAQLGLSVQVWIWLVGL